jgi:hypothetical protein
MNPQIANLIRKTDKNSISSGLSKVSSNDMINSNTIDHYIGKAFSRVDLQKEMAKY